jgi:NAD(P)H-flavin reductase
MQSNDLYKTLRIKDIKENIKDFKTIAFENDHAVTYKAGQYITLVGMHTMKKYEGLIPSLLHLF